MSGRGGVDETPCDIRKSWYSMIITGTFLFHLSNDGYFATIMGIKHNWINLTVY